ncbi:MAG: SET domain-containing protein [Deltaproteobacteria bacterium]|nr:SET domain-containing protein [Deltaproteobacteria bacterium]
MFNQLKKDILERIKNTYCRLQASSIQGVGVFAIRDIPENINPFFGVPDQKWCRFSMDEIGEIDETIMEMIDDFFVIEKDDTVNIPEYGLNGMDMSFFVNHSDNPNLVTREGRYFFTARKVKKGEELTVGYGAYDHKYTQET